jgi:hypothetical protein
MSRKLNPLERILFLTIALLAAYQVAVGIEGLGNLETILYTTGFGILLVASLLLMILGYDILGTPPVVLLATLIPLSVSAGLVTQFTPQYTYPYLAFSLVGLIAIFVSRYGLPLRTDVKNKPGKVATGVLAVVHGLSGIIIFFMPLSLAWRAVVPAGFVLVGFGGALFGLTGILLFFLRSGMSPLSEESILSFLPIILLLTSAAFTAGFSFL